jgi:16S rRNA (guanine966-N2)-methyltransferase
VYVAPPQYQGLWARTLGALDQTTGWLAEYGQVIVQIHPREFRPVQLDRLALFDQRSYGSVMLCFYEEIERAIDQT